MTQVFRRSADTWLRAIALAAILLVVVGVTSAWLYRNSDWMQDVGEAPWQPVPFSHRHHAGALQIDCLYCHYTAETDAKAGYPTGELCMTCHSQLWTEADMLRPVRETVAQGERIVWNKVTNVADFVFFNHAIHVQKGVGCTTCHGAIQTQALTHETHAYSMQWCVDCHRDPAPYLRPLDAVTDFRWRPDKDQRAIGTAFMKERNIHPDQLTHCYVCHR